MTKRKRTEGDDENADASTVKRVKGGYRYNLLDLSDELLIRILSYLTVRELTIAEQVSQRVQTLVNDDGIWKTLFYNTFVRPRARRLPFTSPPTIIPSIEIPHKSLKWLEHTRLLRSDLDTDWKRQYKISSNWAEGAAKVQEMEIATPPAPPVLAKVHNGTLYTVDHKDGLRVWRSRNSVYQTVTSIPLKCQSEPTTIAVYSRDEVSRIGVGFQTGDIEVYEYETHDGLRRLISYSAGKVPVVSIAIRTPYLLTMSANRFIRLYELKCDSNKAATESYVADELISLRADSDFSPSALSLRVIGDKIVASVAYAFHQLTSGWCIGLQEIWLTNSGALVDSRLRSTIETPLDHDKPRKKGPVISSRATFSSPFITHPQMQHAPTSISYSHPYLLASIDNGLMVYIVTSDIDKLEINSGRRLWGHTSAISGTELNERGKAVSISSRGNEIRVWELENALTISGHRKTSTRITPYKQTDRIAAAIASRGDGLGLAINELKKELAITRHWVGFDDEQVVVLGQCDRKQIVAFYNFA